MVVFGFCLHTFKNNMKQRIKGLFSMSSRGRVLSKSMPRGAIRPSRVYRAAENKWYSVDEIYKLQKEGK